MEAAAAARLEEARSASDAALASKLAEARSERDAARAKRQTAIDVARASMDAGEDDSEEEAATATSTRPDDDGGGGSLGGRPHRKYSRKMELGQRKALDDNMNENTNEN